MGLADRGEEKRADGLEHIARVDERYNARAGQLII